MFVVNEGRRKGARTAAIAIVWLVFSACHAQNASTSPEEACARACESRARGCSELQCRRGCAFVIDRLIEREQTSVLACVGTSKACDDEAWARCAVRIGPHADGGPPSPAVTGDEPEW
jgi:hypothetical protein